METPYPKIVTLSDGATHPFNLMQPTTWPKAMSWAVLIGIFGVAYITFRHSGKH